MFRSSDLAWPLAAALTPPPPARSFAPRAFRSRPLCSRALCLAPAPLLSSPLRSAWRSCASRRSDRNAAATSRWAPVALALCSNPPFLSLFRSSRSVRCCTSRFSLSLSILASHSIVYYLSLFWFGQYKYTFVHIFLFVKWSLVSLVEYSAVIRTISMLSVFGVLCDVMHMCGSLCFRLT